MDGPLGPPWYYWFKKIGWSDILGLNNCAKLSIDLIIIEIIID